MARVRPGCFWGDVIARGDRGRQRGLLGVSTFNYLQHHTTKPDVWILLIVLIHGDALGLGILTGVLFGEIAKRCTTTGGHAVWNLLCSDAGKIRLASVDVFTGIALESAVVGDGGRCTHVSIVERIAGFTLGAVLKQRLTIRDTQVEHFIVGDDAHRVRLITHGLARSAVAEGDAVAHVGVGIDVPAHVVEGAIVDATHLTTFDHAGISVQTVAHDIDTLEGVPRRVVVGPGHTFLALWAVFLVGRAGGWRIAILVPKERVIVGGCARAVGLGARRVGGGCCWPSRRDGRGGRCRRCRGRCRGSRTIVGIAAGIRTAA